MTTRPTIAELLAAGRTLVVAHRGNSRAAPENTLPAFQSAVRLGVDMVELDYHHSADGVPVAFHDEELDRLTDACAQWCESKIPLASKSLIELQQLDAGRWFDASFAGTKIPTLEEAIDAILMGALPLIERKSGDAATFVELVRRRGVQSQLALMAFDWDFLADCRCRMPELVLGALGEHELTPRQLDEIQALGAAFVGWSNEHLTREMIATIHGRGLQAWVWTVDDASRARQLVDFGIDAITSNVPAVIKSVVAAYPP